MNTKLREASAGGVDGEQNDGRELLSGKRHGLRRLIDGASQRLAHRRANILIEQETERLWFWRLVRLEVERARRRNGTFTVLCVRDSDTVALVQVAQRVRPQLRDTDAVAVERDRVLILLSDTSSDQARHVALRLAQHADRLPEGADRREVEFPRDVLTLGALIERLLSPDAGVQLLPTG